MTCRVHRTDAVVPRSIGMSPWFLTSAQNGCAFNPWRLLLCLSNPSANLCLLTTGALRRASSIRAIRFPKSVKPRLRKSALLGSLSTTTSVVTCGNLLPLCLVAKTACSTKSAGATLRHVKLSGSFVSFLKRGTFILPGATNTNAAGNLDLTTASSLKLGSGLAWFLSKFLSFSFLSFLFFFFHSSNLREHCVRIQNKRHL